MTLNCLIIDDEPLARQHIEGYMGRVPYLKLVGSVRNPLVGKTILDNEPVDLIFLDINMPQMSGIDFIKQYQVFQQVILVTAFPEYALQGFEVEATDYLVKPVTFERFLKAVEKARSKISGSDSIKTITQQPDFLYVKNNQRYDRILLSDILYIESMLNYINVFTEKGKYIAHSSLKAVEAALPKDKFLRIHKSFIVSVSKITAIEPQQLHIGGCQLPVSRANRRLILQTAINSGLKLTD